MLITKSEVRLIGEMFIWTGENKRDILEHIASLEALISPSALSFAVAKDAPAREQREEKRAQAREVTRVEYETARRKKLEHV